MSIDQFSYVVETDKPFKEALIALRQAAESRKWGVLGDYDFAEILASKGFPQEEQFKTLDLCNPGHASRVVDVEKLAALCMPCSVLVFVDHGKTKLAAMKPGALMPQLFPRMAQDLGASLGEMDEQLKEIVDAAAS